MATDIDFTLNELEIIFQRLIIDMLGLTGSPADYTAASKWVRCAWPISGAPAWKITDNVVFVRLTEADDNYNRERNMFIESDTDITINEKATYTRVLSLALVIYGPDSFAYAQAIRDGMFNETYRRTLQSSYIYFIPNMEAPSRTAESFQGQWWPRVDMEMRFNQYVAKNRSVSIIESAKIAVYDEGGKIAEIEVIKD